ncbi:MAG: methyltransferase domain-containing protein [Saprospiraceae bacterium]|nr:methyltransferase domain-containing protein [Saprospiraceae bacterium]
MNFKFLFPTFRNRYAFVRKKLQKLSSRHQFEHGLNLGTGEGDYDRMIARYCQSVVGCDVNEEDIRHAQALNKGVMNLRYERNDALNLSYPDASFDLLVSCEVIEHVGRPARMVQEIARVLRPGGWAIMTFPSREFPVTYDPVNRIWQLTRGDGSREYAVSQGAYAFGHEYLIGADDFKKWVHEAGLELVEFHPLSGYLVGLLEMYWTGLAQSIFKKNARNVTTDSSSALTVRPASTKEPVLVFLTDAICWIDRHFFQWGRRSVGKGVVLCKPL